METMTESLVNVESKEARVCQEIYNKLQMEVVKVIVDTKTKYFKEGWNVELNADRVAPKSNLFLQNVFIPSAISDEEDEEGGDRFMDVRENPPPLAIIHITDDRDMVDYDDLFGDRDGNGGYTETTDLGQGQEGGTKLIMTKWFSDPGGDSNFIYSHCKLQGGKSLGHLNSFPFLLSFSFIANYVRSLALMGACHIQCWAPND
ncbi:unnamed protein product [Ilex paraguariensis]|uniref:Uncharacterized protein n=1 Tax=Ilex paraguariensis TaxID=185542 RepID=A0ABC8QLR0_9AQUA